MPHGLHQLTWFECCLIKPGKKIFRGDLTLVGLHGCTERHECSWIVGCRIGIGDCATERSHVSNCRIADLVGQFGQRWNGTPHIGRCSDCSMRAHRTNGH